MFRVCVCLCVGMQLYHYTIGENVSYVSVSVWVALARDLSTQQIYSIHIFVFLLFVLDSCRFFCYHWVFAGGATGRVEKDIFVEYFFICSKH